MVNSLTAQRLIEEDIGIPTRPRALALKLRSFHNPTRQRVDVNIDISSLTHRVMKIRERQPKAQLQN
jgi:hypothetical protein